MTKDWSQFTKRINIDATTRAIYNAWAIPEQVEGWFLSRADYTAPDGTAKFKTERVKAGDIYKWRWHGFPNGSPETGKVLEANGHNTFSFTFADDCIVEVTVAAEKGERVVNLTAKTNRPGRKNCGCT